MHTEEFVLIPRQMYANEQPQIAQLLNNKNVREKAKQISLLQRSKSPPAPATTQQETQQQTYNILEIVKDELNESRDDKIDTKFSTEIRERVLRDIKHIKPVSSTTYFGWRMASSFIFNILSIKHQQRKFKRVSRL